MHLSPILQHTPTTITNWPNHVYTHNFAGTRSGGSAFITTKSRMLSSSLTCTRMVWTCVPERTNFHSRQALCQLRDVVNHLPHHRRRHRRRRRRPCRRLHHLRLRDVDGNASVCQCVSVCVSVCQCVSVCVSVCQCVSVCVSV
jgi:hypothetical protein